MGAAGYSISEDCRTGWAVPHPRLGHAHRRRADAGVLPTASAHVRLEARAVALHVPRAAPGKSLARAGAGPGHPGIAARSVVTALGAPVPNGRRRDPSTADLEPAVREPAGDR